MKGRQSPAADTVPTALSLSPGLTYRQRVTGEEGGEGRAGKGGRREGVGRKKRLRVVIPPPT